MSAELFQRTYALEDISISRTGDGRTVDAYAAVFGTPGRVSNPAEGTFTEVIAPGAFDKTIAQNRDRFTVLFNHGKTLYGTPSERFAMPIGKPLDVRADRKGVFTSTRLNRSQLADEVLAGIDNGDIKGMSFTGRFVRSDPASRGRYVPKPDGSLVTVTRTEVAMAEYGPGIIPVYEGAEIVGVRAEEIVGFLTNLDPQMRAELLQIISETGTRPDDAPPPAERSDAASEPDGTSDEEVIALAVTRGLNWSDIRRRFQDKGLIK